MRTFRCHSCRQLLFFESNSCLRCGATLGFSVQKRDILALEPTNLGADEPLVFRDLAQQSREATYRFCANTTQFNACNWVVSVDDESEYCFSCRLTEAHPLLQSEKSRKQWVRVEAAKRRLLYTLFGLGLPVQGRSEVQKLGLAFRFETSTKEHPVTTGHASGVITMNMSEADDALLENAKEKLGEAYRTVLGHLRHECGHYYWELMILPSEEWLPRVRDLFGDDRVDYQEAISKHYAQGAPEGWQQHHISAYAAMHPWEDWAETWAHYLHMIDTLETAEAYAMSASSPVDIALSQKDAAAPLRQHDDFEKLFDAWYTLTFALNSLSRSMGVRDPYPFAPSETVKKKLHLIHEFLTDIRSEPSLSAKQSLL